MRDGTLRGFGKVTRDLSDRREAEEKSRILSKPPSLRTSAAPSPTSVSARKPDQCAPAAASLLPPAPPFDGRASHTRPARTTNRNPET